MGKATVVEKAINVDPGQAPEIIKGWRAHLTPLMTEAGELPALIEAARGSGHLAELRKLEARLKEVHEVLLTYSADKTSDCFHLAKAVKKRIADEEGEATERLELEQRNLEQMKADHETALLQQQERIEEAILARTHLRNDHSALRSMVERMADDLTQIKATSAAMV